MPTPEVYEFSKHVGELCARAGKNVYYLAPKLRVEPSAVLDMINGRVKSTKAVIAGLAKELDSDVRYLEKLAGEIAKYSRVTSRPASNA